MDNKHLKKTSKKIFGLRIHPTVFTVSAAFTILFVLANIFWNEAISAAFSYLIPLITQKVGWFYILSVNIFIAYLAFLAITPYGKIRLGGEEAKPQFSYFSWFAMLFSAGMGIGLLYYGVGEPVQHFSTFVEAGTSAEQAVQKSMAFTFFHWGIHAWAIYGLVGLSLAFFSFNRKLPLTMRSAFYPLLKERIFGIWGNLIDILSVIATLFGMAATLGLGVQQINAGLHHLFGTSISPFVQIFLIITITTIAGISVVSGLQKGVRYLSEITIVLAAVLLGFMLFNGPSTHLLSSFFGNTVMYAKWLHHYSDWTSYKHIGPQEEWTIFYWAWWISWSPFVGMFIAKISKGRTIREFISGVLLVPTLLILIWFTAFGNSALFEERFGDRSITSFVESNFQTSIFQFLEILPIPLLSSMLTLFVIVLFFVTSSDSGSLVIDAITAGGTTKAPVRQRIFWAGMQGVLAIVLLTSGCIQAFESAVITSALPLTVVLLLVCWSLQKGVHRELTQSS